jgi:hypothetical protein
VVRFVEESGRRERTFDFARLRVDPALALWFAGVFAARCGARSAVKRVTTAQQHYTVLKLFADFLADLVRPPRRPEEITGVHVSGFLLRYRGTTSEHEYRKRLRVTLRDAPGLRPAAVAALHEYGGERPDPKMLVPYDDHAWQQIMTALRHTVRTARERIQAGRDLLTRYQAGALPADSAEAKRGAVLDVLDRTGDFPRYPSSALTLAAHRAGGIAGLGPMLCLTRTEAAAFCLLLTALTGQNFGTVADWPAAHHRPDDSPEGGSVVLIEAVKPRRGPEREHMVTALEDIPAGLHEVLSAPEPERRLFRSPLRVYRLLLDLTGLARRHGGHTTAFACLAPNPGAGGLWQPGFAPTNLFGWQRRHGFPIAANASADTKPAIHVGRVRQTVIEHRRRPVAHTRRTMNDQYLKPSQTVVDDSRTVVAAALDDQVAKARARQAVPVFTAAFLQRVAQDPAAAARVGLSAETVNRLADGEHDTVATACVDHHAPPGGDDDGPCRASFLACLDCPNARALPHHLPVQIALHDHLASLRPNLDPATWSVRYAQPFSQLEDILGHYTLAERDHARAQVTARQRGLVEDLINGRLDLR